MSVEVPQNPQPVPENNLTVSPVPQKKSNFPLVLLSLLVLVLVGSGGFILAKYLYTPKAAAPVPNQPPVTTPTQSPFSSATNTPTVPTTTDEPANWKTYNSPEIGDYVSPFQLNYPPTWTVKQELSSAEPKSLVMTLTNSKSETIRITQGVGGGGSCVYYDDPDYTTFEGMGAAYSSYIQLEKPAPWRISQLKDKNLTSQIVCEKNKIRYIDGTRMGWISINVKSETTLQEVKTILEKIVFKPTPQTKTLFD